MNKTILYVTIILILLNFMSLSAQVEYITHDRGMLHQSNFNQGSLGQIFSDQANMPAVPQPSMEWPPFSENIIGGFTYPGQHNSPGSSLWIAYTTNFDITGDGKIDYWDRAVAPGGGVARFDGKVTPVISSGWIFPLELSMETNYQLLDDGTLNPDYNPYEADQIITSKWATWIGVTVTRVSRAWSEPDYDDLIIYELTFENTGNTDYDENTIEIPDSTFKDFVVFLRECFSPSQLGYWRHYNRNWSNRWGSNEHGFIGDPEYFYDNDYWLAFLIDGSTDNNALLAGKPEPNPSRFEEWSLSGRNGGGMLAHQASGYAILHYDTQYLAKVYPRDSLNMPHPENESDMDRYLYHAPGDEIIETSNLFNQLDTIDHTLRQPLILFNHDGQVGDYNGWMGGGWMHGAGAVNSGISQIMGETHKGLPDRNRADWIGRRVVTTELDNRKPITMGTTFGPYTFPPGGKIKISYAEMVGYGGAAGKSLAGGPPGKWKNPVPSSDRKLLSSETNETLTEHYLTDYGYPDHVNSDVITVQDVAHKAWELYLGHEIPFDPSYSGPAAGEKLWPRDTPDQGAYHGTSATTPMQWPSPTFITTNTALAKTRVVWTTSVENFATDNGTEGRMRGDLVKYKVYRSSDKQGWDIVDSVDVGGTGMDGNYEIVDDDDIVQIGNSFYYCVVAVDEHGNESSKITNLITHSPTVAAEMKLDKVYVVPNPFYIASGFQGNDIDRDNKIGFYGLTQNSTIRLYSISGQLIQTVNHRTNSTSNLEAPFYQVTINNQRFASGVYYFVVTDEDTGDRAKGKFVIIK